MFKKLILLALFLGLIPLSCYCPETNDYYAEIKDFSLEQNLNFQYSDRMDVNADSDTVSFIFSVSKFDIVENFSLPSISFSNRAYATQPCPQDELLGWVNKIDSIRIVSDEIFIGIPAGDKINDKFLGYQKLSYPGNSNIEYSSLNYALNEFNGETGDRYFGVYGSNINLVLNAWPANNSEHKFTFTLYSDGKVLNILESFKIVFHS